MTCLNRLQAALSNGNSAIASHGLSGNRYRCAMAAVTAIPIPTAKSVTMDLILSSTARSIFHAAVGSADSTLIRPTRLLLIFSVGMRLLPSKRAMAAPFEIPAYTIQGLFLISPSIVSLRTDDPMIGIANWRKTYKKYNIASNMKDA